MTDVGMTREEHLQWCKDRALAYVDEGDRTNALASMGSDLDRHEETRGHPAVKLGVMLAAAGQLGSAEEMRRFINGFN